MHALRCFPGCLESLHIKAERDGDAMKERLASIVGGLSVDYADLRYEENRKIRISYKGDQLVEVASYETSGGHVRTYAKGGKAVASFSDPARAGSMAEAVAASAAIAGGRRDKPLRLAP